MYFVGLSVMFLLVIFLTVQYEFIRVMVPSSRFEHGLGQEKDFLNYVNMLKNSVKYFYCMHLVCLCGFVFTSVFAVIPLLTATSRKYRLMMISSSAGWSCETSLDCQRLIRGREGFGDWVVMRGCLLCVIVHLFYFTNPVHFRV